MPTSRRARSRVAAVLLVLLGVVGSLLALPGTAAAADRPRDWTPSAGVRISNPLGGFLQRRAVLRLIIQSIDHTPRRGKIRIASWNVRSDDVVDALVRAHRRHVSVRVIVDRGNANARNPNESVTRLNRQLGRHGNDERSRAQRSGVRKCRGACRGERGIAHAKYFLFSRVGKARWVVINSSANATDLSASSQWNDAFTIRGRPAVHRAFSRVFHRRWHQQQSRLAYRKRGVGPVLASFYPYSGRGTGTDPVVRELDRVRCRGARTPDGRTRLRIAMTSWHGRRRDKIAWRVRRLANRGCDVKIVYAVAGNEVLRILRREGRRPIPLRQIVQDFDGDGVYDRYLHTKVLTIRGRYRSDRSAYVTLNGSGNWTPVSLVSDEAVLRIRRKKVLTRYNRFIERLYRNPPPDAPVWGRVQRPVDPYAEVEVH